MVNADVPRVRIPGLDGAHPAPPLAGERTIGQERRVQGHHRGEKPGNGSTAMQVVKALAHWCIAKIRHFRTNGGVGIMERMFWPDKKVGQRIKWKGERGTSDLQPLSVPKGADSSLDRGRSPGRQPSCRPWPPQPHRRLIG